MTNYFDWQGALFFPFDTSNENDYLKSKVSLIRGFVKLCIAFNIKAKYIFNELQFSKKNYELLRKVRIVSKINLNFGTME